ncbi:MAG: MBL fold metallo-hydrolase RNA specificity domain-containing protein, partial [Planctomycetia bacterium]|nr:MBL fold metallo-hydrolase RNA specificity domain-containing protein [Planctomycetia bacterium]
NSVVFLGYQAEGTLGRQIVNGVSPVRIHGIQRPVHAEIVTIRGISGHADQNELLAWYNAIPQRPKTTFVVHGDPNASNTLAEKIRNIAPETKVLVPQFGDVYKD